MKQNFKLYMNSSTQGVGFDSEQHKQLSKSFRQKSFFNKVNNNKNGKTFWLLDGPPYANGSAHMGHALNKVWKDFNVKYNWFLGNKVDWTPGWDCHGLPLELLVEKTYKLNSVDDKKEACRNLALKSVAKQKNDFHSLAVTSDWAQPYLTLSNDMKKHTWKTLSQMYDNGLLEYKEWPTHHCPACGSSLAEAELEYVPMDKEHLYFKYPLSKENHFALVWTTTPWTLPMNQALAYSDLLSYDKWSHTSNQQVLFVETNCSDKTKQLLQENGFNLTDSNTVDFKSMTGFAPLTKEKTPLLQADFVLSGNTGFVHVACAHGAEDFSLGQANQLEPLNLLTKFGQYLEHSFVPKTLVNKKVKDASPDVLLLLTQNDLLLSYFTEKDETAVCWRHKTKVYYQSSKQVFLNLEKLKPKVAKMLDYSQLNESAKSKLRSMLLSRPHWCLSRQRYWGTPMNVVVDTRTNSLSEHTSYVLNLFFENKLEEAYSFMNKHPYLKLVEDVVDVWFDSGNVPLAQKSLKDKQDTTPNLALEGKDQYRGWFQSMLWLQAASSAPDDLTMPYEDLLVHGFVLDQNKNKFAKSNKNGLSAKEAVQTYGADTVRVWAATQEKETDAVFSHDKMKESKTLYQRLRLTLRFLSSNMYSKNLTSHKNLLNKFSAEKSFDFHLFALNQLEQMKTRFTQHMNNYEFKLALLEMYSFFDTFLNPFVFDGLKPVLYLYGEDKENKLMAQSLMFELFENLCPMVAVFCPLTAEEFWQTTSLHKEFETVFNWTNNQDLEYSKSKLDWDTAFQFKKQVLKNLEPLQKSKQANSLAQLKVVAPLSNEDLFKNLNSSFDFKFWLGCSEMNFSDEFKLDVLNDFCKCERCWFFYPKSYMNNENCLDCEDEKV